MRAIRQQEHGVPEGLWRGPHGRVVVGIFSLAFFVAFESLAVATVMPAVADDLGGLGLYALAFAAPIAVGIVSMTIAGPLMDRRGPGLGLRLGVAVFVGGLLVAGLAPTMPVFLAGRAVQGLGMGFVGVGLYVVIGQTFHEDLRSRVFTVVTSAWVLPALVGPFVAGAITDLVGWRWVFLAVPVIAVVSVALIWEALDAIDGDPDVLVERCRVGWGAFVALGVVAVSVGGQRTVPWWPVVVVAGATVTLRYASRLLPAGAWRARRGLPVVVFTRSLLCAAFLGAETYIPLSLVQHRDLSVTRAGLLLTSAAVLWFGGAWLAAHVPALASKPLRVRLGAVCVLIGVGAGFMTLVPWVPVQVVTAAWAVGGLGMGIAVSTLGVLMLDHSTTAEQGANSAAMQTSDAVLESLVLALGSAVFAVMLAEHEQAGYLLVFGAAEAVAVLAVLASWRVSASAS
jgi:MFS family permease